MATTTPIPEVGQAVRVRNRLEECCSEEDIRQREPRILLTNYRQLEVLTTRLPDVNLFAEAPLKYVVFDEAHTYSGASGAEVACLIRRLRELAGKTPDEIICIGTSATLADPTKQDADNEETARRFASRFFGVDANKVQLVGESYVAREWPKQRYRPIAPPGDGMDRLSRVLSAVTEPVNVGEIKGVVEELTGQIFDLGQNWQEALYDHLVTNEYVYQTTQILKFPKRLADAAWQTSQRVATGRLPEGDRANAELLCCLVLGAAARKGGDSLLRPKVHFFLRGLDEMMVALDGSEAEPKMRLFLSLADAKEQFGSRHDDAFFSVLTCQSCGQHFFEKWYTELEFARGSKNQLKDFDHGNATQNEDGSDNAWPPRTVNQWVEGGHSKRSSTSPGSTCSGGLQSGRFGSPSGAPWRLLPRRDSGPSPFRWLGLGQAGSTRNGPGLSRRTNYKSWNPRWKSLS